MQSVIHKNSTGDINFQSFIALNEIVHIKKNNFESSWKAWRNEKPGSGLLFSTSTETENPSGV